MLWLSFRLNSPESCLAEIEWKNTSADDPNNNNKKKALCPGFRAHFWWLLSSTEMLCGTLVPSRHAVAEGTTGQGTKALSLSCADDLRARGATTGWQDFSLSNGEETQKNDRSAPP
jgi:hypothetical protein